jgi:hypothetical protein
VRAGADRSLYNSGYVIAIVDDDGVYPEVICGSSSSCARQVSATWTDNKEAQSRHFHAEIRQVATGAVASSSAQVTVGVNRHDFALQASADSASITAPNSTTVRAKVDQTLYNTGYRIHIVDDSGQSADTICGSSDSCARTVSATWQTNSQPGPRQFHAEVRHMSNGHLAASSGPVTVNFEPYDFNLRLTPDAAAITVPNSTVVRATVNRSLYNTGYQIRLVDDDGDTTDSLCGSTDSCAKTVVAPWSVNPNPSARHFHAVVEHVSNGHRAATSEQVTVVRRRYLFPVDLAFTTTTNADGTVTHRATATTNPSVYNTGYQLKLKRTETGDQLCSTGSGTTCGANVQVGATYRAVVENANGHVAGRSTAWTLTDSGPRPALTGDLDLAALAVAAAGVDICSRIALSPYRTDVVGPSTSAGDQWEACAAAAAAGVGTLAILKAIADTPNGDSNLYWFTSDITKDAPAPGTQANADDAKAPRPVPPPLLPDVEKLAGELEEKQPVEQRAADDVATQCAFLHWRAGKNPARCSSLPIFSSGADVAEATDHDLSALAQDDHWSWLLLNREQSSTKPGDGWQTTGGRCAPTTLRACHEYPFFGTEQGGPRADPEPLIGLVLREQNSLQGTRYSQFVSPSGCNMKTGTPDPTGETNSTGGDPFLSIPLPPEWGRPTMWLCNGKTE